MTNPTTCDDSKEPKYDRGWRGPSDYIPIEEVQEQYRKETPPHNLTTKPSQFDPIVPARGDIEAWRQHCQWAIEFNWVEAGEFNWPRAVLSLIPEWEKNNVQS